MPDSKLLLQLLILVFFGVAAVHHAYEARRKRSQAGSKIQLLIAGFAVSQVLILGILWINHLRIPFSLEGGDGIQLMVVERILGGEAIYPEPSPDYVPFVYMPLYYLLASPFVAIVGSKLIAMRFLTILASIGSGILIYKLVRGQTFSAFWATLALGLVAGSYEVLDVFADKIHPDSWMLFVILLGCYLCSLNRSRLWTIVGVLIVISAFWVKQAAAVFTIGLVIYLTWRDGLARSWVYWILAALFGPVLYVVMPESLVGTHFHYYTSQVPSNWVVFDFLTIRRFLAFIVKHYPLLSVLCAFAFLFEFRRNGRKMSVWIFMIPVAVVNGLVGSLDPESEDNLFLLMSIWFMLGGVFGLKYAMEEFGWFARRGFHYFVLGISFALIAYTPVSLFVPRAAVSAYEDLIASVKVLDGSVYLPWLGRIDPDFDFYPPVQWVAMTDLYRGPGVDLNDNPMEYRLLDPALDPVGEAYILTEIPLEHDYALAFLAAHYELIMDYEDRFGLVKPLCAGRFCNGFPRYLYRHIP